MGAASACQTCRTCGRVLGFATPSQRARIAHYRDFSDSWPEASGPKRGHIVRSTDHHSHRDREIRRNSPKLRCAVQREACGTEGAAGESTGFASFGQYYHRQAPYYQSAGRIVHRLGPRGGEIDIGANDATKNNGWPVMRRRPKTRPRRTRSFYRPSLDVLRRKIAIWPRREDAVVRGTRRAA